MQLRVRRVKTFKIDWLGRRRLLNTQNILEYMDEGYWDLPWKPLPIVDEELEVDDW